MKERINCLMERAEDNFKHIINLFKPELKRYVQYTGFTLKQDKVIFHFRGGDYIKFDCEAQIIGIGSDLEESHFHLSFDHIYDYFKDIKNKSL